MNVGHVEILDVVELDHTDGIRRVEDDERDLEDYGQRVEMVA